MKRFIKLIAITLLVSVCGTIIGGCSDNKKYLYNWLRANGQLASNGTELIYEEKVEDGKVFALHYDNGYVESLNCYVTYTVSDYKGYALELRLPLFPESKKASAYISLINADDFKRGLEYSHYPKDFTRKTPIEHRDTFGDTLSMADYPHETKDGKIVVTIPEEDKPKFEELEKMNSLCDELAHEYLCLILDWLNETLCPKADLTMADLGYKSY